jgi:hypothetical protein
MVERREDRRRKAYKGGMIVFNDGRSSMACLVRNVTPIGALLEVQNMAGLPYTFRLRINGGKSHDCVVRTRRGVSLIGVEFLWS